MYTNAVANFNRKRELLIKDSINEIFTEIKKSNGQNLSQIIREALINNCHNQINEELKEYSFAPDELLNLYYQKLLNNNPNLIRNFIKNVFETNKSNLKENAPPNLNEYVIHRSFYRSINNTSDISEILKDEQ